MLLISFCGGGSDVSSSNLSVSGTVQWINNSTEGPHAVLIIANGNNNTTEIEHIQTSLIFESKDPDSRNIMDFDGPFLVPRDEPLAIEFDYGHVSENDLRAIEDNCVCLRVDLMQEQESDYVAFANLATIGELRSGREIKFICREKQMHI